MCAYYMRVSLYEIERMKTASVYDHRRSLARRQKVITLSPLRRERDFSKFQPKTSRRKAKKKVMLRVNTYQHLDLRDVNRAHYVSFSVLFVSLCCCCCCCSLLISTFLSFSFSFDSIDLDFSLFSLGKSCCCLCVEMMRASFIESFNLYSLLLSCFPSPHTRSSSSSSDVLPMYY